MEQEDRSLWVVLAGIIVFSLWYTVTKRTENALWLVLAAICFLILAYRLYGAFVATRAALLNDEEIAGQEDRLPTERWVLFGYQFASIAGIGVLVGPVLAAQFGYLPGYLWILIGAVLGGAVHDLVVLIASSRRKGAFLPLLIAEELGPWAGLAAWGIVIIALVLFLAVTGSFLADLLTGNIWGLYTVTVTVIVALLVSAYEAWIRKGRTGEAIALGIVLAGAAILLGSQLATQAATEGLAMFASRGFVLLLLAFYCFISAIIPLRALGRAHGAIAGYLGLGGVILLAAGIAFSAPFLREPATSPFTSGNGPLFSGGVLPYLMIIVTGGVLSGFNALVSTGVTSRMLKRETDALPVGFGAMLVQSLLVVLVLVSVSTLYRWDFFAISGVQPLSELEKLAGSPQRDWDNLRNVLQTDRFAVPGGATANASVENVRNTSGVTALASSSAWMFKDFPGVKKEWLPTLYRFMFVLQVLFLLAVVESAMRVGRVAVEEAGQMALRIPPLAGVAAMPQARGLVTAIGTAVLALVWLILAAKTDVAAVLNFMGFVALLLAALGLGAGFASLRKNGRWAMLLVAVPLVICVLLALLAGAVNIKDGSRYISRSEALARVYNDMPRWVAPLKFVNMDRAREVTRQWLAADVARLYAEKGQAEAAKQLQNRFGISENDGKKLAATISSRASGLSLWSWLQIVLTLLLLVLGAGVIVGRFVRVPLRWPARLAATVPLAPAPPQPVVQPAPKPVAPKAKEPEEFEL